MTFSHQFDRRSFVDTRRSLCQREGVTSADIRAFRDRDWRLIQRAKSDYWVEQKSKLTPAAILELAEELRQYTLTLKPDWPDPAEREADFASHTRVAAMLQRAARNRTR